MLAGMQTNDILTKVGVLPALFDAATCQRAIDLARQFQPVEGRVGSGNEQKGEIRRSQIWFFDPSPQTEFIFGPLREVIGQLNQGYQFELGGFATGCQIARYAEDVQGHYDWHIDLGPEKFSRRKLSLSVQLSAADAYDGGDLEFHLSGLDRERMRQQGTLIAFPSFHEHRVTPVTRGERYSLVAWVDGPPFR